MQQEAYDFGLFESRPAAQPEKKVPLRRVEGGKKPTTQLHQNFVSMWNLVGCAMFLALAVLLIQSKVTLTELNTQIQRAQSDLTTSQSSYNHLSSELSDRTNMANIEDAARRLGLMKVDQSQITYIRLEDSGVLTAPESPVKKWTDWFHSGILSLMETLDP